MSCKDLSGEKRSGRKKKDPQMVKALNPEQGPRVPAAQSHCLRPALARIVEVPSSPAPGIHSCSLLSPAALPPPPAFLGLA